MTCEHVTSVLIPYCEIPVSINSIDVIVCTVPHTTIIRQLHIYIQNVVDRGYNTCIAYWVITRP